MSVTMPFTKASFTEAKQDQYKAAVASAAGTSADNVEILDIKEVRRRAGSIQVETKVRLKSEGKKHVSRSDAAAPCQQEVVEAH